MLDKTSTPAEVLADQSRGGKDVTSTDEPTSRRSKRKLKNIGMRNADATSIGTALTAARSSTFGSSSVNRSREGSAHE